MEGIGTIIMVAAAIGAFIGGLKSVSWLIIIPIAAISAVGYFVMKPRALIVLQRGLVVGIVGQGVAQLFQAGVFYGLGRLIGAL